MLASTFLFHSGSTHAASLTVSTDTHPSTCSLSEAIGNINDGAQTNTDCVETGAYGTNDTITIPEGTVLLTADLPVITESVTITGAGMGETTIDGDEGAYKAIRFEGTGVEQFKVTKLTVKGADERALYIKNTNFEADQIEAYGEADIPGSTTDTTSSIDFENKLGTTLDALMTNIYIHDLKTAGSALNSIIISGVDTDGGVTNATLKNITISNIQSAAAYIVSGLTVSTFDGVEQTINVDVSNLTINDVVNAYTASGIGIMSASMTGNSDVHVNAYNITINHIRGSTGPYGDTAGLAIAGAAASDNFSALGTASFSNTVVSDVLRDGSPYACDIRDLTPVFMGTGTPTTEITTGGGNLSDDNSCKNYFTKPTDQNHVSDLGSTLAALADNGGYVPTMALKKGSPAIDAGVTIPTLTTDARLASRPQGTAYDSGAYESPYSKADTETGESLAGTGESVRVSVLTVTVLLIVSISGIQIYRRMLQ